MLSLAVPTVGCGHGTAKSPATPPAVVAHPANEADLNTIRLTPQAEERLGIKTEPLVERSVRRVRVYGGEVSLPPGASIIVSAPIAGMLLVPEKAKVPNVGSRVTKGQPVFLLRPLVATEAAVLSPGERIRYAEARNSIATSRIDAHGQLQQAQVQVDAAKIALDRAERLLHEQAGTVRAVDDAKAQLNLAQETFEAARSRKELLDKLVIEDDPKNLQPLVIEAPLQGLLRARLAAAGEVVAAGGPLFETIDCDPIWVRVPIYVGELDEVAADQPVRVGGEVAGGKTFEARPVRAPPTATPLSSAVDFYYELANPDDALRPGQRVDVALPLHGESQGLTIAWSAVIHDIQGGTWVYENVAPQTFIRRRVQVRYVIDDRAVLEPGPKLGAKLVVTGAPELFGTEFDFKK